MENSDSLSHEKRFAKGQDHFSPPALHSPRKYKGDTVKGKGASKREGEKTIEIMGGRNRRVRKEEGKDSSATERQKTKLWEKQGKRREAIPSFRV